MYNESFSVEIDDVFIKRFGFEEYFNKAHSIFFNPIPHPIRLMAITLTTRLMFSEGIGYCPFCDHFEIVDAEPYNNAFIKSVTEYNGKY